MASEIDESKVIKLLNEHNEGKVIKLVNEPVLDGVHEDDRVTVRNVIYLLHALKLCQSWSVTSKDDCYEVLGSVDTKTGKNTEVHFRDIAMIAKIDPLRVTPVGMRVIGGDTFYLVVSILRKSQPVVLEEQELIQVRRKRKFWNWGGST